MYIDTHCHLNFKAFDKDLPEVTDRAKKEGVEKIIIPGAKIDSSYKAIEIAQKYPSCFAAIGIHPHHADEYLNLGEKEVWESLKKLMTNNKVVAIGEIGLDYYVYKNNPPISDENKKAQKELFLLQLNIAVKNRLPIILHCRNAFPDLLNVLKHFLLLYQNISGVFHCFSGIKEQLNIVLGMGFFVGFDGNITYPENGRLREIVKITPFSQLLMETDAPYLTPVPFRGQRNEPSFIKYIYEETAQIKKESSAKIQEITRDNALKLFNLEGKMC